VYLLHLLELEKPRTEVSPLTSGDIPQITRRSWSYPKLILTGGSLAVIAIALIWFTERAFDLRLLTL
jgi:hypothetical protein